MAWHAGGAAPTDSIAHACFRRAGGGVNADDNGEVTIIGCHFENNTVASNGAGIETQNGGHMTVIDTDIIGGTGMLWSLCEQCCAILLRCLASVMRRCSCQPSTLHEYCA
jgi:hypothetical protein